MDTPFSEMILTSGTTAVRVAGPPGLGEKLLVRVHTYNKDSVTHGYRYRKNKAGDIQPMELISGVSTNRCAPLSYIAYLTAVDETLELVLEEGTATVESVAHVTGLRCL